MSEGGFVQNLFTMNFNAFKRFPDKFKQKFMVVYGSTLDTIFHHIILKNKP